MTIKPGFTPGMEEERDRRRKVLLASVLMESSFCANDVARLLSDHKNDKPVSKDAARQFLVAMEQEGLIARVARQDRAMWCRKKISLGTGPWVKDKNGRQVDNGIRLGAYYPPRPVTGFAELVKRHATC